MNLDNAATTPPLVQVHRAVTTVMEWYGSVHRGAGYPSVVSTQLLERARERVLSFSGARDGDFALFTDNSTGALNVLARRFASEFGAGFPIVVSAYEHSSNLLPWRRHGDVHVCPVDARAEWDLDELRGLLARTKARAVAVTAASNVTGRLIDVAAISDVAREHGALVVVDASQLAAHRPMRTAPGRSRWDFVVFAGHKMFAPYGTGVLVAPRSFFEGGWPDRPGGGTIQLIDGSEVVWAGLPEREGGGTPNYPGLVAMAEACSTLEAVGFDRIASHERALTARARSALGDIAGVTVHRPLDEDPDWLPLFPFSVAGMPHGLVAAYLGIECGIAVRSGHLCQYELVRSLTSVSGDERRRVMEEARSGDLRGLYGVVRASAGASNTVAHLEKLAGALRDLVRDGPRAEYTQSRDGRFRIVGWSHPLPDGLTFSW